ncbi:Asparagine synthetase [glutamine-hydrolyzing] 1 [Chlamydiales bacterium SCGC AG-110-M15]|nr:Asparagine synthetase [glutamine-hydrolyzing] 1 [Chlamydiales bacterium SCGC AG-110-M15]
MCGIVGGFLKDKLFCQHIAQNMLNSIHSRGPDDSGLYINENLFLGSQRLSIQDLSTAGHMPMWDESESVCTIFNGEIYNFKEIRKELSEFTFRSNSDTEVVLYAYIKWGLEETVKKLNGMFSICIYDNKINHVFLARDRVGIKPLYYFWDESTFLFSSELKSLHYHPDVSQDFNELALLDYFIYRYIAHPKTIFKNCFKLSPGTCLSFNLSNFTFKTKKYWTLNNSSRIDLPIKDTLEEIEFLINDSINYRLIADTPIASFLSGGIDSSLISTLAHQKNPQIKAFTIDLRPEKYSELAYAKSISEIKGIPLLYKTVGKEDFEEAFDQVLGYLDEPFADSSIIPTFLLCKAASEAGYKCALSGDGADELFFGYKWHKRFSETENYPLKILQYLPQALFPVINAIKKFDHETYSQPDPLCRYRSIMFNRFTVDDINKLFGSNFHCPEEYLYLDRLKQNSFSETDIRELDFSTFLVDDILHKVDMASMAHSLEVRVPYLDHRLVELLFSLSHNVVFQNRTPKYLLKQIAKKHLPSNNITRPKQGFSAPVMTWVGPNYKDSILNGQLAQKGLINPIHLQSILKNDPFQGKAWQVLVFEKWFEKFSSKIKKVKNTNQHFVAMT